MSGTIGFKASVSVTDGSSDAAVDFDGLQVVSLPSEETGEVEVTDHNQTDFVKRHIPTLIDPGTLKIEIKASEANITRVRTLANSRAIKTWKVKAPAGTEFGVTTPAAFSFPGFVKKRDEVQFEREGVVMVKFEVRVTGPWTATAGV